MTCFTNSMNLSEPTITPNIKPINISFQLISAMHIHLELPLNYWASESFRMMAQLCFKVIMSTAFAVSGDLLVIHPRARMIHDGCAPVGRLRPKIDQELLGLLGFMAVSKSMSSGCVCFSGFSELFVGKGLPSGA